MKVNVDLYSASSWTHLKGAQVWHAFSRDLTVIPAHLAFIGWRNEPYLPKNWSILFELCKSSGCTHYWVALPILNPAIPSIKLEWPGFGKIFLSCPFEFPANIKIFKVKTGMVVFWKSALQLHVTYGRPSTWYQSHCWCHYTLHADAFTATSYLGRQIEWATTNGRPAWHLYENGRRLWRHHSRDYGGWRRRKSPARMPISSRPPSPCHCRRRRTCVCCKNRVLSQIDHGTNAITTHENK